MAGACARHYPLVHARPWHGNRHNTRSSPVDCRSFVSHGCCARARASFPCTPNNNYSPPVRRLSFFHSVRVRPSRTVRPPSPAYITIVPIVDATSLSPHGRKNRFRRPRSARVAPSDCRACPSLESSNATSIETGNGSTSTGSATTNDHTESGTCGAHDVRDSEQPSSQLNLKNRRWTAFEIVAEINQVRLENRTSLSRNR